MSMQHLSHKTVPRTESTAAAPWANTKILETVDGIANMSSSSIEFSGILTATVFMMSLQLLPECVAFQNSL